MSRYMALADLVLTLKANAWPRLLAHERAALEAALAVPENDGDKRSREEREQVEESLRMAGF